MDEQLIILNLTEYREFDALDEFITFLTKFVGEDYIFPLIFNKETLYLKTDLNSQGFIKEYLSKVQKFSSFEKSHNYKLFEGHIRYRGLKEEVSNQKIFEANVNLKNVVHHNVPLQRYNLSLFFGKDVVSLESIYYARINKTKSIIDLLSENGKII